MKAEGEWERFIRTGRIYDYLNFKDREQRERMEDKAGERFYAGFRDRDGNSNQGDTCR